MKLPRARAPLSAGDRTWDEGVAGYRPHSAWAEYSGLSAQSWRGIVLGRFDAGCLVRANRGSPRRSSSRSD